MNTQNHNQRHVKLYPVDDDAHSLRDFIKYEIRMAMLPIFIAQGVLVVLLIVIAIVAGI